MIRTKILNPVTLAIGVLSTALLTAQTVPTDSQTTCTVSTSVFNTWFQSGTPSLNGVVNPADSVTFANTPNCSFYLWSKQMFLWLTSPAPATYGGGGGRIFDSPAFYDVTPEDSSGNRTFVPHAAGRIPILSLRAAQAGPHGLQIIFDRSGKMFEVQPAAPNTRPAVRNAAGALVQIATAERAQGKLVLTDPAGKTIQPRLAPAPKLNAKVLTQAATIGKASMMVVGNLHIFIDPSGNVIDTEEGEADFGVLLAQNGSLVYFITMVNDVYAYFRTGLKDGSITPAPTQFPTTAAELAKITTFAGAHGKTFPDPHALAIEVKSSWVEAAGLPNLSTYITRQGTIPTYDKSNPNKWVPNGHKTVELALVGMHVVGSTAGHPEMIWATFEHFNNSPNAAYTYNSTSGSKTVSQNTSGNWIFAKNGAAAPFNVMHENLNASTGSIDGLSSDIVSSNIIRWKAFGAASNVSPNPVDGSTAASNTEIISIHNSVGNKMPAGDVRDNYVMTGSTWTIGGAAPTASNQVGTSRLANTTMETFVQGTAATSTPSDTNCFTCHTKTTNMLGISHVFNAIKPLF